MKRLNYSQMANKNLNNSQKLTFFKANQMHDEHLYERERYDGKVKYAQEHFNLSDKLNGMVSQVYTQLMDQQPPPYRLKLKQSKSAKQNAAKNLKDSKFIQQSKNYHQPQSSTMKPNKNKQKSVGDSNNTNNVNIPHLKVLSSNKQQQRRNSETKSPNTDSNNFQNHKRMKKVADRQVELENMLAHHKQLRQHRQSIAQDIFAMRHSLDDVRHRLNNSLEMLNKKKTYSECHRLSKALKCKKFIEKEREDISNIVN